MGTSVEEHQPIMCKALNPRTRNKTRALQPKHQTYIWMEVQFGGTTWAWVLQLQTKSLGLMLKKENYTNRLKKKKRLVIFVIV